MLLTKSQPRTSMVRMWDPFAELAGLRRMFDQPFEALFEMPFGPTSGQAGWQPVVDVLETKDGFVVKAEIAGVKPEDIHIDVEGDTLTLKGERKHEKSVNEAGYSRIERSFGAFQRSILLPPTVDTERVKASYVNGVLEVQLPKKEEAKPKRITVQTA
jgi:HSP20 family protein